MKKLRVGILFGGLSAEHEVSIQSARNVAEALDPQKYEPVLIGISKQGKWLPLSRSKFQQITSQAYQELAENVEQVSSAIGFNPSSIDVVFPVLHGPFGEDGTVQGMLKLMNIPFVGASVLGSAVGMDKDVMKRLLRDAGIAIARFISLQKGEEADSGKITKQFGLPLFVKPANLGSSVGVSKATNEKEFTKAVQKAFQYDSKILIEEYIQGREIECSVLGNNELIASVPGEITPTHEFYDYEAKYLDESGAVIEIPAKLPQKVVKEIQETAIQACKVLCVEGMARVDFFLTTKNKVYVNEINTIPGFTNISMYPKLWEASGISYQELIDRLIQLALDRHNKEQKLRTSF